MDFRIIIPARLNSSRLPEKVLADIAGKPMIQRAYDRAIESGAESVIVATDNSKVAKVAESFGATVCMTSSDHHSGTERIAEAVVALGLEDNEIIVNLQCDEPLMPSSVIRAVAQDLEDHDNVKVSTICVPMKTVEELFNPDVVKVVMNKRNYAMYFSRAPIPWDREHFKDKKDISLDNHYFRHVGIYAYRVHFLQEYMESESSSYENLEALEQLHILWHGGRIHMLPTKENIPHSVDTSEDLEKAREIFKKKK